VFQEWLLSRRVVSFAPSGIYFDCQSELPRNANGESLVLAQGKVAGLTLKPFVNLDVDRLQDLWWDIVEAYSALELSFPEKDRLLALSGIAAEFSVARGKTGAINHGRENPSRPLNIEAYVSGLWFGDIHRGLLWQQKGPAGTKIRAVGMPTWSWTSLMSPVTWRMISQPQVISNACEILGIVAEDGGVYPAPAPHGKGNDSEDNLHSIGTYYNITTKFLGLHVRCRLCVIRAWDSYTPHELETLVVPPPSTTGGESYRKISLAAVSHPRKGDICGWGSFEDPGFQNQRDFWDGQSTYALHVLTSKRSNGWLERGLLWGWERCYDVIFVQKVDGDRYRRIGMGAMWGSASREAFGSLETQTLELV
jgi:hypothetical protein